MMTPSMADIRFPRLGRNRSARGSRRSLAARQDPLDAMAAEIQELNQAARTAAARIAETAREVGEGKPGAMSETRAQLLAGVASALVERSDRIRAECEELSTLVARSARLVAERDGRTPAQATGPEAQSAPPTTSIPPPEAGAEAPVAESPREEPTVLAPLARPTQAEREASDDVPQSTSGGTSEGVRLIATQMAIAGSSRAEIEHRLRIQFGVDDAEQALDDIFGNRRSGVQ
jgi:hypothetical protein